MRSTFSDDTMMCLREYGFEMIVVGDSDDEYDYVVEVEWDGIIDEHFFINDMFGYSLPGAKLFDMHKRQVERGNADKIRVVVRDLNNGVVWDEQTLFPESARSL